MWLCDQETRGSRIHWTIESWGNASLISINTHDVVLLGILLVPWLLGIVIGTTAHFHNTVTWWWLGRVIQCFQNTQHHVQDIANSDAFHVLWIHNESLDAILLHNVNLCSISMTSYNVTMTDRQLLYWESCGSWKLSLFNIWVNFQLGIALIIHFISGKKINPISNCQVNRILKPETIFYQHLSSDWFLITWLIFE